MTLQGFKWEHSPTGEEKAMVPLFIASLSSEEADVGSHTFMVLIISLMWLVMLLCPQGPLDFQYLGKLTLQAQWYKKGVDCSQH